MNRGAFGCVTKTIEFDDLEMTIQETLDDLNKLRELHQRHQAGEQANASSSCYFSPIPAKTLALVVVDRGVHLALAADVWHLVGIVHARADAVRVRAGPDFA